MPWPLRTMAVAAFAALACGGSAADDHTTSEDSSGFPSDDYDDTNPSDPSVGDDGHTGHSGGDTTGGESGPRTTQSSGGDLDDSGDPTDASGTSATDGDPPQDPLAGMGELELVADGFAFAEGPVWVPELGALLFTDIPNDAILRLDPTSGSITPFLEGTGAFANGLDLDDAGDLLVCEGGLRRVTRRSMTGGLDVLADLWSGDPFNAPNDVASHPSGSIFFTDPTYGTDPGFGGSPPVLGFQGIYRLSPGGDPMLVADALVQPNGIAVSPDGGTLYVVDTVASDVWAWPLADDGTPGTGELCFHVGDGGDGMTIDRDGNLYVTTTAGVQVWRPADVFHWGTIALPGDPPTNCAFGGDDLSVLYITTPAALYRVRLAVPGLAGAS
jgi:gluconolactonase